MSFSFEVCEELLAAPQGKTCCKKAMLLGLLYGARAEDGRVSAYFKQQAAAERAAEILRRQFSSDAEVVPATHAGRQLFLLSTRAKSPSAFIFEIDRGIDTQKLFSLVGFRCADCANAFLRGVFIATGSVNDPHKGYHLEFSLLGENRAALLRDLLEQKIARPNTVKRGERVGLYYKSNAIIGDLIYYIGGTKSSFDVANVCIERDIRNTENRATNCVARNIARSVSASVRQVEQIESLIKSGAFYRLGEELKYTANLRLENPDASLSELALMHEPPISKSGLNRRLTKIAEAAGEDA